MGKSTFEALLARGLDSQQANKIISDSYNLTALKGMKAHELEKLGLSEATIKIIQKEPRPPIPTDTVIKLLYDSKRTCCVCRDNSKSIIIHHIEEWNISKSHAENNLVVLCLDHHDEAHTQKVLSLNLTKDQIIEFKAKWIENVKTTDAFTILGLMNTQSRWDYVNLQRIFELLLDMNINFQDIKSYNTLLKLNIIDNNGVITDSQCWDISKLPSWHLCDFQAGIYLGHYLKVITERIISNFPLIDITNNLNKTFIKSIVKVGSIITGQLGFYFSNIDKFEHKAGILEKQLRRGYYKGNDIIIDFQYDARNCTSSSGRFDALSGHKVAVPILFVRSIIENKDKHLVISGSCLAIGTWFENHRKHKF